MFYGVFLAPLLFAVAPARIVFKWILVHTSSFIVAIIVAIIVAVAIFGIVGAIAASLGHKIGLKIAKNLHRGKV